MAMLSFKLDKLFIVQVPELVVMAGVVVATFSFPSDPDFVQTFLSIESHFVNVMIGPLVAYPLP
jgi:hypothetical protein